MKKLIFSTLFLGATASAVAFGIDRSVMSEAYWKIWNDAEQARIDADIEKNRKANAHLAVTAGDGAEVEIEQVAHDFRFGAHIFNFNQLGKTEYNDIYKSMYGAGGLFNQATVSFYWIDHELTPGVYRFDGDYRDTEQYWNSLTREEAMRDRFWRRPAPAPVIDFLKIKDVAIHGHVLIWGCALPYWTFDWLCSENEKRVFDEIGIPRHSTDYGWEPAGGNWTKGFRGRVGQAWKNAYVELDEKELARQAPEYAKKLRTAFRQRVESVAKRFGEYVDSWDVVNESAKDFRRYPKSRTGLAYWFSHYGLMPGDYPLDALLDAKEVLPAEAKFAINDYFISQTFLDQVEDLKKEGARIDIVGCQMHIFDTNACARLAAGATNVMWVGTPASIRERLDMMAKTERPLHISEVTIAAPGVDEKSRQIQAVLVRNIYRTWFSHPKTMGITWWNTVDGAGVAGEPLVSGLLTIDMKKKPAYEALDELINKEWKTRLTVKAKDGFVDFRGFRGKYRVRWVCDKCGGRHTRTVYLTGDGVQETATDGLKKPCTRIVRHFTVDGKKVEVSPDEEFLDLAKIYPNDVGGMDSTGGGRRDGTRWAEVAFEIDAPAAGNYRLNVVADWFGEFIFADGKVKKMDGPGDIEVPCKEGRNVIRYRSRAGSSGKWNLRMLLPRDSKLGLGF